MSAKRKAMPPSITQQVLHEAGFRCSNPACRTIITLEIHHLDFVSAGGENTPDNLLALCPNCHTLHHNRIIPIDSLRAWKHLLLSLNEGFDRISIDTLLVMPTIEELCVTGDGFIHVAGLVTGGYLYIAVHTRSASGNPYFSLKLTPKGHAFVEAWKAGNQRLAVESLT